jgi:hypothetical protein
MKLLFHPDYSFATIHTRLLRRLLDELTPPDLNGTLTVLQLFRDYPVTFRLRADGVATASAATLTHSEYFAPGAETRLRQKLAELFRLLKRNRNVEA